MSAPAKQAAVQEPDFFTGTRFACGEIEIALQTLTAKVRDLKRGNETGRAVDQKLAAEAIAKTAGQIQVLGDLLARVSISHINRKSRIA